MAFQDELRSFLENRLLAYDAGIDLSPDSPAQSQIIDPVVERFAEDPFSVDIPTFIEDLMTQQFPELVADGGGMLGDLLTKPMQMLLEPFKRNIELVKLNQSAANAALMSDDEADALGANFFQPRNEGGESGGSVRLYFAQPTTSRVTPDKRVFTAAGLSFFPTESFFITSQQMLFNRQGSRYFMDITVRAELPGDQYNIDRGDIIGVENVSGVVQATNLARFTGGSPREDNEEYLANVENSLTEQSLVTRRGITTRIPKLFDSVRALSIVGAGEEGMDRDILDGGGQGFVHMAGKATIYGDWLFVSEVTYKDDGPDNNLAPQVGDLIRFHQQPAGSVTSTTLIQEARVTNILTSASTGIFLFLLDRTLSITISPPVGRFALFKPGFVTISGVPGGQGAAQEVPDESIHLGGHTDVFVRPMADTEVTGTLSSVTDGDPLLALTDVQVNNPGGSPVPGQNIVSSTQMGSADNQPQPGDLLVIETGASFAGSYRILEVGTPDGNSVRVDATFTGNTVSPSGNLRARVVRSIRVNLVEPRTPKLPFNTGTVFDLNTNVGSNTFTLDTVDIQSFGGAVGDVIRILDGLDAGDFVITDFDLVLGGRGPIVDRAASATAAGLRYEVFTAQTGLQLPLVRVKSLEVLDSTQQGTGIKVPYGDAVDIRPHSDFEGAGREVKVLDKQMFLFPDLLDIWGSSQVRPFGSLLADQKPSVVTLATDARYTQNLEIADGIVRRVPAAGGNPITNIEVNLPPFCWNGKRDKLMAFTTKKDLSVPSSITGNHETSEAVDASVGDTLTLLHGPNQGSYIIKDKRVLDLWGRAEVGRKQVTILQVDPELPVDPFRTAINLINDGGTPFTAASLVGLIEWASDFDNPSGFYNTFLTTLLSSLSAIGVSFPDVPGLKEFFDPLITTGYSIGPAARGDFRLYFQEPVSTEFYFGDDPTTFVGITDPSKVFRIDPALHPAQIFPEAESDSPPTQWLRNIDVNPVALSKARLLNDSFPAKGIRVGDSIEFHSAIDEFPARPQMSSSWLATTQAGSNILRLILPAQGELTNYSVLQPGQLLFIDSGPDIGAYTITAIEEQNWVSSPPVVRVRVDKSLTHTTGNFPTALFTSDFASGVPPYLITDGNVFPMTLDTTQIDLEVSVDGGVTFPVFRTFTFGPGVGGGGQYVDAAEVVTACSSALIAGGHLTVTAQGNEILIRTTQRGPNVQLRLAGTTTTADLQFGSSPPILRTGGRGAAALQNGKRIYGSGLANVFASISNTPYVMLYAAKGADILGLQAGGDGDDTAYLGSFQITDVGTETDGPFAGEKYAELSRSADFPTLAITDEPAYVRWILHPTPATSPPDTTDGGKEISDNYVRIRLYEAVPRRLLVIEIPWNASPHPLDETSVSQLTFSGLLVPGANWNYKVPYRFIRPGVKRFSSTSMALKREGALYYVDLPVVGLGPGDEMNILKTLGFKIAGRSLISGYTLQVRNSIFTFSSREQVDIILPNAVLPVGSTPELDNQFNLAGQNIQVVYDNAPLIDSLQRFFDSPQDRVLVANTLVRHFLPSYVFLDVAYSGGSSDDVVAKDVINYINNISPDRNVLEASKVVDLLKRKGASAITLPITLIALTHGIDRSIRGMRSEDNIGASSVAAFKGNFNQSYFISGPDTSRESVRPDGEQVFLKKT